MAYVASSHQLQTAPYQLQILPYQLQALPYQPQTFPHQLQPPPPPYQLAVAPSPCYPEQLDYSKYYNSCFRIYPVADGKPIYHGRQWEAKLYVRMENAVHLLERGFQWSAANVDWEKGFIMPGCPGEDSQRQHNLNHSRYFFLSDKSNAPMSAWEAVMIVWAEDLKSLGSFEVDTMDPAGVIHCSVWQLGKAQNQVYHYSRQEPWMNFNAIHNNMPLSGWWPWPKEKPRQSSPILRAEAVDSTETAGKTESTDSEEEVESAEEVHSPEGSVV